MVDIEQARELLAAEYDKAGEKIFASRARSGRYDNDPDIRAIAAALRAAPEQEFRDPDHLAEYLGNLVSNDEEWDAGQAAMWGVRAIQGDAVVQERLQAVIEGECAGLAITPKQASAILHYVLQPLDYDEPDTLATVTPPRDLRTKLGDA